jgi:hypothetical protein
VLAEEFSPSEGEEIPKDVRWEKVIGFEKIIARVNNFLHSMNSSL